MKFGCLRSDSSKKYFGVFFGTYTIFIATDNVYTFEIYRVMKYHKSIQHWHNLLLLNNK